jgi:PIN domain nuclease of toxin-antitoxin system
MKNNGVKISIEHSNDVNKKNEKEHIKTKNREKKVFLSIASVFEVTASTAYSCSFFSRFHETAT